MATIKDVAKISGFSVCTVSRTLSGKGYVKEDTRKKIMEAVTELSYRPNSTAVSLKTGRNHALALILPSITNIYYPKLAKYVERFANEQGYMIYLCNSENSLEKERKILQNIPSQNIAGVIITPSTNEHSHIMKLRDFNIPYIYLNRNFTDDKEHCIRIDNRKAAYDAVSYLIQNGHRAIGGIFQSFGNMSYEERYDGMVQALKDYGLPVNPRYFLFDTEVDDLKAPVMAISRILEQPDRPEAIFACNDMIAFSVYKAAYGLGLRIPDDLSVFGYDNCIMADMVAPPLSTFATPAGELSRASVSFIDHYIKTGKPMELPILEGHLVIRESVKNKRNAPVKSIEHNEYSCFL